MEESAKGKTLIVSWHWPPAPRASARVLRTLFSAAPPSQFRAVTRNAHNGNPDPLDPDPLDDVVPAVRTPCVLDDSRALSFSDAPAAWKSARALYRAAQSVAREWRPDRLFVVYPHRYGLLTGWRLARRLNLPLILYMHDLLAEGVTFRNPIRQRFWQWIDSRILRDASMIVTPTEEFADVYRRRGLKPVTVLPHCIPSDIPSTPAPKHSPTLKLLYSGLIYEPHASAALAFIEATRSLSAVNVTWHCNPEGLDGRMRDAGAQWVSRDDASAAMRETDAFVVLLGRDSPCPLETHGCFPSKIVDYLAVGRPILAIVPPDSFVDRFTRESGCGISVTDHTATSIRNAIDALRHPDTRQRMTDAARKTANRLRAEVWITQLGKALGAMELNRRPQSDLRPLPHNAATTINTQTPSTLAGDHA